MNTYVVIAILKYFYHKIEKSIDILDTLFRESFFSFNIFSLINLIVVPEISH